MARVTHKTMAVEPEQAQKWLERNIANRTLRPSRVKEYATAMSEGRWLYTADPIRFDSDGKLIDGQHRLMAVVRSGCTVEMHVVRGLSPEAQDKVDTGAIRTAADALKVRGFKHGSQLAATIPIVNWLLQGGGFAASYSRDDVVYWTGVHEGLDVIVEQAYKDRNLLPCQLAPFAAAYYAARKRSNDPAATDEFFVEQLVNTIGLTSGSPALATRKYLLGLREDKRPNNKAAKASTVLALLEGYTHFRANRSLFTMRAPRGGWPVNDRVDIPG
ncbi:MAG: hypothetical protein Q4G46_04065 [Propionibacteriaceae bacterium]|nr:hypothetical protein [Propionibacteriaceae bacterium]